MHHLSTGVSRSMARSKGLVVIEGNVHGVGRSCWVALTIHFPLTHRIINGYNSPTRFLLERCSQ
jgi:hypothetical protein